MNIYTLTDTDGAERLKHFNLLTSTIKTLYILYLNENGAQKHANGADSFSDDMTTLRQECDSE